ncbi:methyl-accepting chemotaxis protein [Yoonia litorea]|uniref:Methyl-accepting chemotaxis protein n=1 Tax=Yoonia litorea TaxID=1123755 RepID=A0A1I6LYE0_9RHOB|nr:methyl-accepting chemotaxis protein [Yoonia litorea]SFS08491.1 methyl-accepting chemotaxis protein [Yoonia litorea]
MLESWSISRRIGAGFVIMILMVAGLALFSYRAVGALGSGYLEYRNISAQSVAAAAYMEDVFEARIAAFRYRSAPNAADRAAVLSNIAEVTDDTQLVAAFEGDPSRLATIEQVRRDASAYQTEFMQVSALLGEAAAGKQDAGVKAEGIQTLVNDIFTQTVQTGSTATITAAGRVLQLGLGSLVSVGKFFESTDASDLNAALAQFGDTETALRRLDALNQQTNIAGLISSLQRELGDFPALLENFDRSTREADQIQRDALDQIGPRIEATLDQLSDSIVSRQNVLGPEGAGIVASLLLIIPSVGLLSCLIAIMAAFGIGRWITKSVKGLADTTEALAGGDNAIEIRGQEHRHELGRMARSLAIFKDAQIERAQASEERAKLRQEQDRVVQEMKGKLASLAKGDLQSQITDHFAPEYEELRINFNDALEALESTIGEVAAAARRIGSSTQAGTAATNDLSQRTENQAATLEETAAALDELTASVKSAAEHAKSVDASVAKARREATENGEVVAQAVAAMAEIENSSSQIARVIGVIDDIAFQTNLLALNAGVEAARAGESGRGFAVVASEVRALAQRSADAAKEISALIGNSSRHVAQGTTLVGNAGEALNEIISQVNDISHMTSQIATSAEEQSIGLSEINIGVNQLDQVTQQNAAMVQESLTRSDDLLQETDNLLDKISRFRVSDSDTDTIVPLHIDGLSKAIAQTATDGDEEYRSPQTGKATGTDDAAIWEEF